MFKGFLPPRAMTSFAFCTAVLVAASSGAVTPLYHLYQQSMNLTPLMITVVFAIYSISLLMALLTIGGLSDYVGRRPVVLGALLLNVAAMILFSTADTVGELILARAVQGVCVGAATTALGAALMDTNRALGPLLNSVQIFLGLMAGALGAAILVTYAPDPLHLVYEILLAVSVVMILLLGAMPETTAGKTGALASLVPHVSVPAASWPVLLRLSPVNIACWALGGLYLSLMPTLVAVTLHAASPLIGGIVVGTLMLSAVIAVSVARHWPVRWLVLGGCSALILGVAVSLIGIELQNVVALLAGTFIAGLGFGTGFSGTLGALLPTAGPNQRAGLLAAFYTQSYLAFSLPSVAAGLAVPFIGLSMTAYIYGAVVMVLTAISMIASMRAKD
jgi:hypothetical protein